MSLLMDALRKAEQEKREAAKRLQEAAAESPALEGADEAGQESHGDKKHQQAESGRDSPNQSGPADLETSQTILLTLAPLDEGPAVPELNETIPGETGEQEPADESAMNLSVEGLSLETTHEVEESDGREQRQSGPALEEDTDEDGAVSPFDETYSITSGQETIKEQHEKSGENEILTLEESGPRPTPVTARTVFSAGSTTHPNAGRKWAGLAGIMLILALFFYTLWYYMAPSITDIPSPTVASGVESYVPAMIGVDEEPENLSGTLIQGEETDIKAEGGEATAGPDSPVDERPSAAGSDETSKNRESGPVHKDARPPVAVKNISAVTEQAAARTPPDMPETLELKPSLIRISRSRSPDDKQQLIQQAYNAYREGDFVSAETLYRQVQENYPDSRDALLGIGAISLNNGEPEQAFEAYMRVLAIDPANNVARAAIISMQKSVAPLVRESAIKTMLQGNPDIPFLHFILGNIYAGQSRWPEAQQAFFDAYRYDSSNPDYALNLAISLDRIGQTEAAYDYYNTALKLADSGPAMFDPAMVIERIEVLSAALRP